MKKYFKLQAKKSLSLLMAVIMLMTCWVWVAPEKAAAADQHNGEYQVRLIVNITDKGECTAMSAKVHYDGGSKDMTCNTTNMKTSGEQVVATLDTCPGFPVGYDVSFTIDKCNGEKKGTYKDFRLQVYSHAESRWVNITKDDSAIEWTDADGERSAAYGSNEDCATLTEKYPKATTLKNKTGVMEYKTMPDIPKLPATDSNVVSVPCTAAGVYDQYDVKMATPSYMVGDNAGNEYTKDKYGIWLDGTTVKANANVQKGLSSTDGKYKVYLVATYGELKKEVSEITLNYPTYTVKVDQNGSISDLAATMEMNDGSTRTIDWSDSGFYGNSVDSWPKGGMSDDGKYLGASKAGYTFKGFWTTKQPTEGAADYNAYEADFANPVDSTTFDTYKAQEGAVLSENNLVVTLSDGKKYYNAGRQWDAAKDKQVLGDATFYGWWISQDVTVKFYDIDGSYLGTQTTKYGKTEAEDWYPNPKEIYNAGAYDYQGFAKQWRDITGVVIKEGLYKFGDLETLSLTPIYTTKEYKDKYTVTFINPTGTTNVSKDYPYRDILSDTAIPTYGVPTAIAYDNGYSYEFAGWTTQVPANGKYHIVAKNDTSITANTDWVVREDTTYYAIYKSTVKEYVIAFKYTDTTGTEKTDIKYIAYGSAITTPADVNRTYATGGYGYTLEGWDYKNNAMATVMLGVDETLVFNDDNVLLTAENLKGADTEKPIVFTANYDDGQPTPYTVTFKFKDAKGVDAFITAEVYHGYAITQEIVDRIAVPAQYDDGTALYTFSDLWKITEGTADKAEYTKGEFTSFSPTSHVTFEAVYGEGVPFYTVKYIDGAKTYSERVLAGDTLPAWMEGEGDEAKEYVPAKEDTETGTYKFAGWFDEEQADKDFAETNGKKYTVTSTIDGDVTLYPQFEFEPFKFTIKFMDYTGKVQLAIAEVEAGQSFKAAFDKAQGAAQHRAPDETYSYTFIGWDYKVPDNYLCEGKDMTYTAQYRPSYVYYKANWYKSADEIDGTPLATTNHTYNGAVYAPSVELEIEDGKVFAGWYYKDGENEVAYQRGMTITKNMSFYAKYSDAPKSYTITAHIGDETYTYTVAEGKNAEVIGTPVDGYIDEENHNDFIGWYTTEDFAEGTEFDMNEVITENIEVYAKIVVTTHDKSLKELISAPTYYKKGSEKVWCACSKEDTIATVDIPMLTDTVAPTGTIYLGTQGKWSSTDANGAADTDGDEVAFYANADTDIILTINDTGDVDTAYNPSGVGKGIANIQGIISTGVFGADTTEIAGIQTIFTDSSETLNNTANYVTRLGDYSGLEDGKTYIAYYYAKDKAGNELNRNVRTAKFIYDTTAPEFSVEGDCNAETATYCGKAVIKGIENDATVTVNGEAVELTTAGASGATAYTITEAGNYLIKVTDKAGNSTSKKIKVTDGHDEVTTEKAATCNADGYEKVTCAVCAKVIKNEVIKSEGHKYGAVTTVAPTCDEKGYELKVCSVCGDENKTNENPAAGHKHAKDAEGNIVYTVVTPATCSTKGKKISNCTVCGKDTKTEEIPADTNAHVYGATKTLKATCDAAGEKYQNCKYCFVKKTVETLPALNHVDTGRYTKVTTAATCYSEGVETTYCKACDKVMGTTPVAMIAHTLVLVKYEGENNDDKANYPNGYMQYECKATGCTHTEAKTAIAVKATYIVTFKGAGAEGADVVITKTEGESIDANAVADQTKAKDNEYEYKFAGWKGSDGKVVKLPVKVTKNETYTAEFTATKRIYTHKFLVEGDEFATVIGTYNAENKKPAATPTKLATATATYTFAGWKDTAGNVVTDFTMTDNATFVADFTSEAIKFNVVYLNEGKHFHSESVNGGASHTVIAGVPEKAYDDSYHYTFAGWAYGDKIYSAGAVIDGIKADYRFTAKYTAVEHEFDETVADATKTWDATCTKAGQITKKCDCGCEKATSVPMIEHNYEIQEDGSKKCSGCGNTVEAEAEEYSITIAEKVTYYDVNGETVVTETEDVIKTTANKTKTYKENADVEAVADDKDDTAKYTVEFIGWSVGEGGEIVSTAAELNVKATSDVTYVANYKAVWRVYSVSYLDSDYNITLQGPTQVKYGDIVPEFEGTKAPSKASTDQDHYIHIGWSVEAGTVVKSNLSITPKFDNKAHTWVESDESVGATCTTPGGKELKCACGATIISGEKPATGHNYKVVENRPADYGVEGYVKYECQNENCPEKIKEEHTPALTYKTLTVTVLNAPANAIVELRGGAETVRRQIDDNAKAVFGGLKDGDYTIVVEGVEQTVKVNKDTAVEIDVKAGTSGGDSGSVAPSCSCGCHRPGFWGVVFRFFHKIISWFTGRIGCCACPSPLY